MAGRIERVVPGRQAEVVLAAEIGRVQAGDPLAPVLVVVRSPLAGLSLRRRLAEAGPFAAVRFAPFGALVEQLGVGTLEEGRQPLSRLALRAAARAALGRRPGLLAPVSAHRSTEASLVSTYRELRRLKEEELERIGACSRRAADVVALVGEMRRVLGAGYYDAFDLLGAATARLREVEGPGDDLAELGSVVVHLPDPVGPEEAGLLSSLARHLEVVVLTGVTGDELADRATGRLEAMLDGDPAWTQAGAPGCAGPERAQAAFAELLSAPDEDVEVREAVRRLVTHAEGGGDLGRCVVAYPDGARSAGVGQRLVGQLRAAGIPWSGGPGQRLGETPHGRLLAGLAELAVPSSSGHELDRGRVMAWLGCGPVRLGRGLTRGLATVEEAGSLPIASWERCSRLAGVLGGVAQWRSRLRAHITAAEAEGDVAAARATADLLQLIERLQVLTSAAVSARSWADLGAWTEKALEEVLEPGEERTALAESVADVDALDAIEPIGQLPPAERLRRFTEALNVALDRPAGDRGRFGVGPVVGPLSAVAGVSSDLLLVLGCREGELPGPERDDPLVRRGEREEAGAAGQPERSEERGRRHLLSLLSASSRALASFARVDVRAGRLVYPSPWAVELCQGRRAEIPSFAGSIRRLADGASLAADATDFELASLLGAPLAGAAPAPWPPPGEGGGSSWLEALDGDYGRRRESTARRRRGGLNPFAGYVPATGSEADAWSEPLSATGLEIFARCPFRFFVERKLGVEVLEAPERLIMIDPRARGTLMHEVLEGFFGSADGPPASLDGPALERLRSLAARQFERFRLLGKTGKAVFWETERGRILRDLERYLERDLADCQAAGRLPLHVELDFGGEDLPVVAEVSGRAVRFRGRIDRIDRTTEGGIVVVDYKSGKNDDYREIRSDPLGRGSHLQLPIYARAAEALLGRPPGGRPTRAEYRFLQAAAAYDVVTVELTEELDAEFEEVLRTLVATVDAGCFPPRPGPPEQGSHYVNCRRCDLDRLCTTDRVELWERASEEEEMKAYRELVAGPLPEVPG